MAFFALFHDFYTNDSYSYVTAAQNLVSGDGFTNAAGYPETIRTPGYPLFIAPFLWMKIDPAYLIILQHCLRVLIVLGPVAAVFHLTRSRLQAAVAGIVMCLDLPLLEAANTIMTEILFTAVFAVVLWLLWEAGKQTRVWSWPSAAGLLAGASVLIRPVSLLFLLPAAAYLSLVRKNSKLGAVLCFGLAFGCFPLMWAARNYSRTDRFVVCSISAWNMLGYRAAGVLAIDDPGDFSVNLDKRQEQLTSEVCEQMRGLYGSGCVPLIEPQGSVPQKSEYYMRLGREVVMHHPFAYVKLAFRGAAMMMLGGGAVRLAQFTGITRNLAAKILLMYTLPAFCFATVGAWKYWRENRRVFFLLSLTIIYFVTVSAGAEAYSRLRVPIMPIYAILIAAGTDFTFKWFSRRTRKAFSMSEQA